VLDFRAGTGYDSAADIKTPSLLVWILCPNLAMLMDPEFRVFESKPTFDAAAEKRGDLPKPYSANSRSKLVTCDRKMLRTLPTKEIKVFHSRSPSRPSLHVRGGVLGKKRSIFSLGYLSSQMSGNREITEK
jgi:hypothetical protein